MLPLTTVATRWYLWLLFEYTPMRRIPIKDSTVFSVATAPGVVNSENTNQFVVFAALQSCEVELTLWKTRTLGSQCDSSVLNHLRGRSIQVPVLQ